jgi:hypothetical protein
MIRRIGIVDFRSYFINGIVTLNHAEYFDKLSINLIEARRVTYVTIV